MNKPPDQLNPGESGIVTKVGGQGALRRRLLDMGITPKTKIFLVKAAPMGDPLELSLRGFDLSIRKADAQYIELEIEDGK